MSLSSILNTAIGALQVNQTALKVTSSNIANINTEGYHRRVVEQGPRLTGSQLSGVTIEEIRRITDHYLNREAISTASASGQAEIGASFYERVQHLMGSLDGGSSLANRVSDIATALAQLETEPASSARRVAALSQIQSALSAISGMALDIQVLRQDASRQIAAQTDRANSLISQIADLNGEIRTALVRGETGTGLLDQRDRAIAELSQMMDIQTFEQADGRVFATLADGTQVIGDLIAQFSYTSPAAISAGTSFPPIEMQRYNPATDQAVGPVTMFEGHVHGGSLRGLIDLRDKALPDLAEELGAVAGALTEGLNAIHSNASAVPAPDTLWGTNTGLLAGDALRFTGKTTLAVTDAAGALVRRIEIDFDAGTLSVNGGGPAVTGGTVSSLVAALNAALAGDGSASFASGILSLQATAVGNGLSFAQDATAPSARGGRSFAQYFGLNDLVRASVPSSGDTGFAAADAHGFTLGGTLDFVLRGPDGAILSQGTYTAGGATVGDIVSGLNTALGGTATFALDASGAIGMSSASGARLEISNDLTSRGATGVTVSGLFALGTAALADRAQSLKIRTDIASSASKLSMAKLDLSATTAPGDIVLGRSDNRAAQDMAALVQTQRSWDAAGGFGAAQMSISDYVSQLMASQAGKAQSAAENYEHRAGVAQEVQGRKTSIEGVNLDEELALMIQYQQAYNAAARMVATVQQMFDTLINTLQR
jgi:flagellar hook-associated protein 1 FlgK